MTGSESIRKLQNQEWIRLLGVEGFAELHRFRKSMGVLAMATLGYLVLWAPAFVYGLDQWLFRLVLPIMLLAGVRGLFQILRICDDVAEKYGIDRRLTRRHLDLHGLQRCERSIQKIRERSER